MQHPEDLDGYHAVAAYPVTLFRNDGGPLTKAATLAEDGEVLLSAAATLARGRFRTEYLATLADLARMITTLSPTEAIAFGVAKGGIGNGRIAAAATIKSGQAPEGAVARSHEHFEWPAAGGWLMLDIDLKDAIPHLPQLRDDLTIARLREVLVAAAPGIADAPMLGWASASACLYDVEMCRELRGLTGARFYIPVARAADIPELGRRLHEHLVLAGYGFAFIAKSGVVQLRSLLDASVWQPVRLDFVGGAACGPGIEQRRGAPQLWNEGAPAATLADVPAVSGPSRDRLNEVVGSILSAARPAAERRRAQWLDEQRGKGRKIALARPRRSIRNSIAEGDASVLCECLTGDHEVVLTDGACVTVDSILADPARYHEMTCADPLEPEYGGGDLRIGKIFTVGQRTGAAIYSHAHGGITYMLQASAGEDFAVVEESSPLLPPAPPDQQMTDMGNAGRFARTFRDKLIYAGGRWLQWDCTRWKAAENGEIDRCAKEIIRAMGAEAFACSDSDRRKQLAQWAIKSQSRDRIRAMLDLARPELSLSAEHLDSDPFLLTVLNGTLDLRSGVLREHRPTDLITKLAPVRYDPSAQCAEWTRFLRRILAENAELISFVQRAVGYSLTGSTREQVLFLQHGSGANGKSTMLEVLRQLFGDYSRQAEFSTFMTRRSEGPRNDIARLHGARFVAATEVRQGEYLDEAIVKSLTGGDTVTARFLHKEFFEFQPSFKIWLAANHKPRVRGGDLAIWRRVRLIPFEVTIPEDERDPQLVRRLVSDELPGILNWAIAGCLAWQREGLGVPDAVREATADYRAAEDNVGAFLQRCCELDSAGRQSSSTLHAAYVEWCRLEGEIAVGIREFTERLPAAASGRLQRTKSNGVMTWKGIRLLPVPVTPPGTEFLIAS